MITFLLILLVRPKVKEDSLSFKTFLEKGKEPRLLFNSPTQKPILSLTVNQNPNRLWQILSSDDV